MKNLIKYVSILIFSVGIMCACKEDEDVRDNYVGEYSGILTNYTYFSSQKDYMQESRTIIKIAKNGTDENAIDISIKQSGEVLFHTTAMKEISFEHGTGFCGNIKNETSDSYVLEGENYSEELPYSCVIIPNADGKYVLTYNYKKIYRDGGNIEYEEISYTGEK